MGVCDIAGSGDQLETPRSIRSSEGDAVHTLASPCPQLRTVSHLHAR